MERINYVDFTVAFQEDVGYFMVKKEARREFLSFFDKVSGVPRCGTCCNGS